MNGLGLVAGGQYYGGETAACDSPQMARMPSMKERLELAVKQAEEKLAMAQRARELFNRNPDLEELLNIMQRSHF